MISWLDTGPGLGTEEVGRGADAEISEAGHRPTLYQATDLEPLVLKVSMSTKELASADCVFHTSDKGTISGP